MAKFRTNPVTVEVDKVLGLRHRPFKVKYPEGKILYFSEDAFLHSFTAANEEAELFLKDVLSGSNLGGDL